MNNTFNLTPWDLDNRVTRLDGKPFDQKNRGEALVLYKPSRGDSARIVRLLAGRGNRTASNDLGRYYLAGPMRGYDHHNFPAFLLAARVLTARGIGVVSPAEKDIEAGFDPSKPIEGQGFDMNEAFRWDFQAVIETDGIILLPGWEKSTGAKAERVVAQLCGRPAYELDAQHNLVEAREADYELTWEIASQPLPAPVPLD